MKVRNTVAALAGATALVAALAACSSSSTSGQVSIPTEVGAMPATSSSTPDAAATAPAVTVAPVVAQQGSVRAAPAPNGQTVTGFPPPPTTPVPVPPVTRTPPLTGPVTFDGVSLPRPYNCQEAGTTYYTPPNILVGLDVTVLVTSPSLATDLTIAAPNSAPRGLDNSSRYVSSTALGHGVWRATYLTWVALAGPHYPPFTVNSLHASANGVAYTIAFGSPFTVSVDDCNS